MALVQAQHRPEAPAPMGPVDYPREDVEVGASLPFSEHGKRIYSLRGELLPQEILGTRFSFRHRQLYLSGDHPDILRIHMHVITCTFVYLYANTLSTP